MEFKFDVSDIFPSSVVEINPSLIPPGFAGDRRGLTNVVAKVAEVVNAMGDASAAAQGLSNPITTAERLRKADQTVYLLVDREAKGGKGVVTGMLKTGKKSLYIFDRDGQHHHVSPPCVLDFYVHESRQRTGLGKQLFEHMLKKESAQPANLAIDRPSEKLLSFMTKHYGLQAPMRQMNNYVVFDGFFPDVGSADVTGDTPENGTKQAANGLQTYTGPLGRYGAPRPPCSMGQIIHNQTSIQSTETTGPQIASQ